MIFYPVIDHAGEAPIMSSQSNLHLEFCVVTRKLVTAVRINLPDMQEFTLEVKPSLDHLSLPLTHGHITVFVVITGHQVNPHSRLLLLPLDVVLEQLVGDEEGGEAPHEEAGAEHHPPPAGHHHGHTPHLVPVTTGGGLVTGNSGQDPCVVTILGSGHTRAGASGAGVRERERYYRVIMIIAV